MSDNDLSVEERVVQKLKKVITIKKQLTPKQQAHIDNLATKKKGTKYTKQVDAEEIKDIPTEIKELHKRKVKKVVEPVNNCTSSEESEVVIIKKKKPKKIIKYIEESESEEPKKKPKAAPKVKPKAAPKAKPKVQKVQEDEVQVPIFNKKLF